MWKRIGIGVLVVILLVAGAGLFVKEKVERQFEQFIRSEMERKAQEEVLAVEAAMKKESLKLEVAEEKVDVATEVIPNEVEVIIEAEVAEEEVLEVAVEEVIKEEPVQTESTTDPIDEVPEVIQNEVKEPSAVEEVVVTSEEPLYDSVEEPTVAIEENESSEVVKEELPFDLVLSDDYEADKQKAMALAFKRLTPEQISRLMSISSGGFTPEEKQEAKQMFYGNFSAEEQEWILVVYSKYYLNKES